MFAAAHGFGKSAADASRAPSACPWAVFGICRFYALSCIRTTATDTPYPGGVPEGHCSPGLRHHGWGPTAVNRRPRSDLVKFKHFAYATVNY
jgi:hypothetical protein